MLIVVLVVGVVAVAAADVVAVAVADVEGKTCNYLVLILLKKAKNKTF